MSTLPGKGPEARAHHFVPQCWLAGFTDSGQKDGRLFVTDLKRGKQWQTSPLNAGHMRDFYRLSDPKRDPLSAENAFAKVEDIVAPLLKALDDERRPPTAGELEPLAWFMALQWARVPAFRPWMFATADSMHHAQLLKNLESPESWAAALKEAGIAADSPGAGYEGSLEFVKSKQYTLSVETDWYLYHAFRAAQHVEPLLRERCWEAFVSSKGNFIASDNPVNLDGPKGQQVGFKNAEVVFYPLSRHLLLVGTNAPIEPQPVSRKFIAHANAFTMMGADAQLYSHVPDFYWEDESGKDQVDWRLFSKEKFQ